MARCDIRKQDAQTQLNYLRKRLPGQKPVNDLERIAAYIEYGADNDNDRDDADALRRLAERLRELRAVFYGENRRDRDARLTAEYLKTLRPEDGAPFEEA